MGGRVAVRFLLRLLSVVLIALILLGWVGCVWAIHKFNTSTDELRGEVLMVLPVTSLGAAVAGIAIWVIRRLGRPWLRRWEQTTLAVFGILGPLLLVGVLLYDLVQ